jgi:hypothetical protein
MQAETAWSAINKHGKRRADLLGRIPLRSPRLLDGLNECVHEHGYLIELGFSEYLSKQHHEVESIYRDSMSGRIIA